MIKSCIIFISLLYMSVTNISLAQDNTPNETPSNEAPPVVEEKNEEVIWKHSSIMYNQKNANWINEAIKSNDEGIPLEILLPDIFPPHGGQGVSLEEEAETIQNQIAQEEKQEAEQIATEAPIFHLSSIANFGSGGWALWINGEKISDEVAHSQLDVVKVSEKDAVLVWRKSRIDRIFPQWRDKFLHIGNTKYVSNGKNIVINVDSRNVSFILGINQSLVTSKMEIVEGEVETSEVLTSLDEEETIYKILPNAIDNTANVIEDKYIQEYGETLDTLKKALESMQTDYSIK